ncbi:MAG: hypothetical protein HY909_13150 [Deltaproteobacteria bacterium]|nr:hypothetical protein [Deltaproteobacteria bacterium]
MYDPMTPCERCGRHLRRTEGRCPFCAAARVAEPCEALEEAPSRLSRAALLLGASMAIGCPLAAAYGGPPVPAPHNTQDAAAAQPTPAPPTPPPAPAYGAPPAAMNPATQDPASLAGAYGAPPARNRP